MVIYLLVNVSLLLTSGRLGDMLAPGKLYLLGLVVFTGASALCGLSSGLSRLLASRALQAVGASLMLGVAPKLIVLVYGPGERGLALGLFSTAFASGISVGAPLGGLITAYLGWPYIFLINIPICLVAYVKGRRPLRQVAAVTVWARKAFDFEGAVILAGTLASLLLAFNWLRQTGWRNGWTLALFGVAAALGLLLFRVERRHPKPLLSGELWRRWPFIAGSLAVVLTFGAVMGTFFLMPFFLEQAYGYSPDQSGFLLAAISVTNALVAPFGGYLADRLGNLLVLRCGSGLILLGLGSLILTGPETSTFQLAARFVLIGLGFGLFQAPNLNEILRGVQTSLTGLAASTNAVLKNLGALLGITLIVMVYAWFNQHQLRIGPAIGWGIAGFQSAFAVSAVVAGLNLLTNLLPRKT